MFTPFFRCPLQKHVLQGNNQSVWGIGKREFTKITRRYAKENVNESKILSYIFKFGFSGLGVTAACILKSHNQIAICREAKRISDVESTTNPELIFEWKKFFKYLYPHIWYLLLALSVSIICVSVSIYLINLRISYGKTIYSGASLAERANSCTVKYPNSAMRRRCYKRPNRNLPK